MPTVLVLKVPQNNECVPGEALVYYGVEFGLENLILFGFTHFSRSIHSNKRPDAQSVCQPHSHYMLFKQSNLHHRLVHLAGDAYNYLPAYLALLFDRKNLTPLLAFQTIL